MYYPKLHKSTESGWGTEKENRGWGTGRGDRVDGILGRKTYSKSGHWKGNKDPRVMGTNRQGWCQGGHGWSHITLY